VDEAMIQLLDGEITRLERYIERRVAIHDKEGYTVLRSVPGIGRVLALVLLYEIQDLARFRRVQHFSSYCRVVNPQCESNGKRAGVGEVRRGNRYLCWALHELVNSSCRHCPAIKAYYARLRRRRSARHAHRIMAHRWAVTIYFMLKRKEPFDLDKFLGSAYESAKGSHCADR
jgi:transposase